LEEAGSGFPAFETQMKRLSPAAFMPTNLDSIYAAGLLLGYATNDPIDLDHASDCDAS
jgi:hypothetical protein